jgi:1-acyl-sn-glycerol-3-phosphate acyltransferase
MRLARADRRRRVLLLSTDPAHSLGDVFRAEAGDTASLMPGAPPNLVVRELDAAGALASRRAAFEGAFDEIAAAVGSEGAGSTIGAARLMDLAPPGIDELFGILSVVEARSAYDVIVVDTAPTGHALRLLEMPEAAREWTQVLLRVLLKYRSLVRPGRLAEELVGVSKAIRELIALLRDEGTTMFIVVTRAAELPRRSLWLVRLFRWYARRYVRKHFHAVQLSKSGHAFPPTADEPLLIVLNHPAWWDPMICVVLSYLMAERDQFAAIDAEAVKRYAFFKKMGFVPVDTKSLRGAAEFVRTGATILAQPNRVYWVTAQGRFADVRERPLAINSGVGYLASRLAAGAVLPLALEYAFWTERTPEALVREALTPLLRNWLDANLPAQTVSTGLSFVIVPVKSLATMRALAIETKKLFDYLGTTELLVVANLSDGPAEAGIPAGRDWAAAELLLSNYPPPAAATFVLRAWEARVYRHSGRGQPPVG